MIRQLVAQHPSDFSSDLGVFDQLVRSQHYGLPTRLLDVSLNPLVALYFAVCSKPSKRGQVIVFKPDVGKQKYYDSDVVSCMSALCLLSEGEKTRIAKHTAIYLRKSAKDTRILAEPGLDEYNSIPEMKKLIQLVRQEKSDFRPIVQPRDLVLPVAVVPRKLHSRILAQNGAFILFGLARGPTENNMKHIQVEKMDIDESKKDQFISELSSVGITESSLFPEIEKAALAIKSRYR